MIDGNDDDHDDDDDDGAVAILFQGLCFVFSEAFVCADSVFAQVGAFVRISYIQVASD